jgi:hypothetical protein
VTWTKLDDRFWRNRKIRAVARRDLGAVGLFAMAITYAADHRTDGQLTEHDLEELCPRPRLRRKLVRVLVAHGLFERGTGRYEPDADPVELPEGVLLIHDFLWANPPREQLERDRYFEREKKRRRRAGQRGELRRGEAAA